ncbi:MAG TPA: hypothetical protein VLV78_02765 [Thermoanaerobaculia bacterium]|nr:hypothetical protein [Thermoanaerobaculia bacterium]
MSSRAAAVGILTLAIASSAFAAGGAGRTPAAKPAPAAQTATVDLTSLFETPSIVTTMPHGMLVATAPTHLVMLARVGDDGKILLRCVGSAEAAENFLRKPDPADIHKPQVK